jgi:Spy/CpxP family protein refolding chaperone
MTTSGITGSTPNPYDVDSVLEQNKTSKGMHGKHKKPNVDDMVTKLGQDLNLTDDQKSQLKSILEKDMASGQAQFQQNQTSSDQVDPTKMKSMMQTSMDNMNNDIKSILSPDQLTKFNSIMDSRKSQMPTVDENGRVNTYA